MDQQLRQRIVGATVLVVLAVILVPWVLDGPETAPQAGVELQLPAPGEEDVSTHTIRLDPQDPADGPADEAAPVSGAGEAETSTTDRTEEPADDAGRESTADTSGAGSVERRAETGSTAAGEDGGDPIQAWAVQVFSLTDRARAEAEVSKLRESGFPAFLARHETDGTLFYRVRVGPEQSRETAERLAARVSEATGTEPAVVEHP